MPFEIFQSEKTSKFYFRLKARNGEIILASEAYSSKQAAKNGINSVVKMLMATTSSTERPKTGEITLY